MMIILKRIIQLQKKKQKGATAVEFAIVILIFVTIVFGIIEFGLLMYNQHIVTNAAREGARFGIVIDRKPEDQIKQRVSSYADQYLVTFGGGDPDVQVPNACTQFGDDLSVTVEYKYNFLFLRFLEREISSTTIMKCE